MGVLEWVTPIDSNRMTGVGGDKGRPSAIDFIQALH